jgi:hypothetical protein
MHRLRERIDFQEANRYLVVSQDGGPQLAMLRLLLTSNEDIANDPLLQRAKAMLHVIITSGGPFHTLMNYGMQSASFGSPLLTEFLSLNSRNSLGHIKFVIKFARIDDSLQHDFEIGEDSAILCLYVCLSACVNVYIMRVWTVYVYDLSRMDCMSTISPH